VKVAAYKRVSKSFGQSPKFVLWLQGCLRNCKNCIAEEWQSLDGGFEKSVCDLSSLIYDSDIEGVVISGGEPLLQYEELLELLSMIKKEDKGIILYTGFLMVEIKEQFPLIENFCDVIIDGEYKEELNNGKGFRGSSNQTIHFISNRYLDEKEDFLNGNRIIEITEEIDGTVICGIPPFDLNIFWE